MTVWGFAWWISVSAPSCYLLLDSVLVSTLKAKHRHAVGQVFALSVSDKEPGAFERLPAAAPVYEVKQGWNNSGHAQQNFRSKELWWGEKRPVLGRNVLEIHECPLIRVELGKNNIWIWKSGSLPFCSGLTNPRFLQLAFSNHFSPK